MLGSKQAATNIAVKDLARARKFYEGTLGLRKVDEEGDEVVTYKSGDAMIYVYRSEHAGTNKATALTWNAGNDVTSEVEALKAKGVSFEHYDMPGMRHEGDVHVGHDMKVAWFKDPDGNILSIASS
jgi:catechol 2,3-dioxygenase-like lactoylglutathione lyase family enzyme